MHHCVGYTRPGKSSESALVKLVDSGSMLLEPLGPLV